MNIKRVASADRCTVSYYWLQCGLAHCHLPQCSLCSRSRAASCRRTLRVCRLTTMSAEHQRDELHADPPQCCHNAAIVPCRIFAPAVYIFFCSAIPALAFGEQLAIETGAMSWPWCVGHIRRYCNLGPELTKAAPSQMGFFRRCTRSLPRCSRASYKSVYAAAALQACRLQHVPLSLTAHQNALLSRCKQSRQSPASAPDPSVTDVAAAAGSNRWAAAAHRGRGGAHRPYLQLHVPLFQRQTGSRSAALLSPCRMFKASPLPPCAQVWHPADASHRDIALQRRQVCTATRGQVAICNVLQGRSCSWHGRPGCPCGQRS